MKLLNRRDLIMSKTYLIQTNKNVEEKTKKDLVSIKSSSDVNVAKEFETDNNIVTVVELDDLERVNGLRKDPNVVIEENQKIKTANLDSSWLNTFKNLFYSFFLTKKQLNSQSVTNTEFIDVDLEKIKISDSRIEFKINPKSWNIPFVKAPDAWRYGFNGNGATIAVLDTGILPHECLMGNLLQGINFCGPGKPIPDVRDDVGHGLHVASTSSGSNVGNLINSIFGVAPQSSVLPLKVLGTNEGDLSDVIEGFVYATQQGVDVINMSLGGGGYSKIFHDAIIEAANKNIFIVAATGNSNNDEIDFPSKYPEVFAVASVEKNRRISWFSNHGDGVNCCAPGGNIFGAAGINEIVKKSGTSMATPHVAGAGAILKQMNKSVPVDLIKESIQEGAVEIIGVDSLEQGSGILNVPNSIIRFHKKISSLSPSSTGQQFDERFYKDCRGHIILDIQRELFKRNLYTYGLDGIYGNLSAAAVSKLTNGRQDYVDQGVYFDLMGEEWPNIFERSLQLTSAFEGTGYTRVVGNFDNAILTWGIIGFNIKFEGVQRILAELHHKYPGIIKNAFKGLSPEVIKQIEYYDNTGKSDEFVKWGLNVQTNKIVHKPIEDAFKTLGNDVRCQEIQRRLAKNIYWNRAASLAKEFRVVEDLSMAQLFDCAVQGFSSDARKLALKHIESGNPVNGQEWTEKEKRKIIAQSDAQTSLQEWQNDTWLRKSLFITGEDENLVFTRLPQENDQIGTSDVHGRKYKLSNWGFGVEH